MRIRSVTSALGAAALALSAAVTAPAQAADYPVLRGSQIEDAPPPPDYLRRQRQLVRLLFRRRSPASPTPNSSPERGFRTWRASPIRNTLLGAERDMGDLRQRPALEARQRRDLLRLCRLQRGVRRRGARPRSRLYPLEHTRTLVRDYIGRRSALRTARSTTGRIDHEPGREAARLCHCQAPHGLGLSAVSCLFATIGAAVGRFNTIVDDQADWVSAVSIPGPGASMQLRRRLRAERPGRRQRQEERLRLRHGSRRRHRLGA